MYRYRPTAGADAIDTDNWIELVLVLQPSALEVHRRAKLAEAHSAAFAGNAEAVVSGTRCSRLGLQYRKDAAGQIFTPRNRQRRGS